MSEQQAAIVPIPRPEIPSELLKFQGQILKMANDLVISDAEDYQGAFAMRREIRRVYLIIEEIHAKITTKLHTIHKEACADRDKDLAPFDQADRILERKRLDYDEEKRKLAAAKEQRDREAAQLERHETALAEAAELESIGEHEAAEEVIQQAITAPAPAIVVEPDLPKSQGQVKKKKWKFRVVDESKVNRAFLTPDLSAIRRVVESSGPKVAATVGGIEVYEERSENVRV